MSSPGIPDIQKSVRSLKSVAPVEEEEDEHGVTVLMHAVMSGDIKLVKWLVIHGDVNVNTTDELGSSAVHYACTVNHQREQKYLHKKAHALMDLPDREGVTPLMIAIGTGNQACAEYLIHNCHCDQLAKDGMGLNVLMRCSLNNQLEMCQWQLNKAGFLGYLNDAIEHPCLVKVPMLEATPDVAITLSTTELFLDHVSQTGDGQTMPYEDDPILDESVVSMIEEVLAEQSLQAKVKSGELTIFNTGSMFFAKTKAGQTIPLTKFNKGLVLKPIVNSSLSLKNSSNSSIMVLKSVVDTPDNTTDEEDSTRSYAKNVVKMNTARPLPTASGSTLIPTKNALRSIQEPRSLMKTNSMVPKKQFTFDTVPSDDTIKQLEVPNLKRLPTTSSEFVWDMSKQQLKAQRQIATASATLHLPLHLNQIHKSQLHSVTSHAVDNVITGDQWQLMLPEKSSKKRCNLGLQRRALYLRKRLPDLSMTEEFYKAYEEPITSANPGADGVEDKDIIQKRLASLLNESPSVLLPPNSPSSRKAMFPNTVASPSVMSPMMKSVMKSTLSVPGVLAQQAQRNAENDQAHNPHADGGNVVEISAGTSALGFAIAAGHQRVTSYLIGEGAQGLQTDVNGYNCAWIALKYRRWDVFLWCYEEYRLDLTSCRDKFGNTFLHYACICDNIPLVLLLLCLGSDPDAKDSKGRTCVMTASLQGHGDVVSNLLSLGARIDLLDDDGRDAQTLALSTSQWNCVRFLDDEAERIARAAAEEEGITDAALGLDEVTEGTVDWNGVMQAGETVKIDVVAYAERNGVALHTLDKSGRTFLQHAALNGRLDHVRALVERGHLNVKAVQTKCFRLHAKSTLGMHALSMALSRKWTVVYAFLVLHQMQWHDARHPNIIVSKYHAGLKALTADQILVVQTIAMEKVVGYTNSVIAALRVSAFMYALSKLDRVHRQVHEESAKVFTKYAISVQNTVKDMDICGWQLEEPDALNNTAIKIAIDTDNVQFLSNSIVDKLVGRWYKDKLYLLDEAIHSKNVFVLWMEYLRVWLSKGPSKVILAEAAMLLRLALFLVYLVQWVHLNEKFRAAEIACYIFTIGALIPPPGASQKRVNIYAKVKLTKKRLTAGEREDQEQEEDDDDDDMSIDMSISKNSVGSIEMKPFEMKSQVSGAPLPSAPPLPPPRAPPKSSMSTTKNTINSGNLNTLAKEQEQSNTKNHNANNNNNNVRKSVTISKEPSISSIHSIRNENSSESEDEEDAPKPELTHAGTVGLDEREQAQITAGKLYSKQANKGESRMARFTGHITRDAWALVDAVIALVTMIVLILRLACQNQPEIDPVTEGQYLWCVSLLTTLLIARVLEPFTYQESTGPLLISVFKMLGNVKEFWLLFTIPVIVIYFLYYFLVLDPSIEPTEGFDSSTNIVLTLWSFWIGGFTPNMFDHFTFGRKFTAIFFGFIASFIISVLLLNMLVGIMGNTMEAVADNARAEFASRLVKRRWGADQAMVHPPTPFNMVHLAVNYGNVFLEYLYYKITKKTKQTYRPICAYCRTKWSFAPLPITRAPAAANKMISDEALYEMPQSEAGKRLCRCCLRAQRVLNQQQALSEQNALLVIAITITIPALIFYFVFIVPKNLVQAMLKERRGLAERMAKEQFYALPATAPYSYHILKSEQVLNMPIDSDDNDSPSS